MWAFLKELFRDIDTTYTVLLLDESTVEEPRRYQVDPRRLLVMWGSSMLVAMLVAGSVLAFTPLRQLIPGYGTEEMERSAQLNAVRVAALQDTLSVQQQYIERLQALLTGGVDGSSEAVQRDEGSADSDVDDYSPAPSSDSWSLHEQPALTLTRFSGDQQAAPAATAEYDLPALSMPVPPPVETGYPTRGFDPRAGHYALDIAVQEGSFVRTIGDGYVVLSDWTQEGGYTIAVQHGGGYLSVYKHNKRVLKQVGEQVREQEVIAVTGNSGEITTGPHLHFELWHHGLAQDPRSFIAGW